MRLVSGLLIACGLLALGVAALVWVNNRRLSHYNDELNDLRQHVTTSDGQLQQLNQQLEDCLHLKSRPDSSKVPFRTNGWE